MGFIAFAYRGKCKICRSVTQGESLCCACKNKISYSVSKRERTLYAEGVKIKAHYLFDHDVPVVKSFLYVLKRNGDREVFKYASELFEMALPENTNEKACVFVPRKAVNVRKYGYDHIKRSLKLLCKNTDCGLEFCNAVKRKGVSKEQKNLTATERAENVKDKFSVTKKNIGKDVLLFDDVVTTGSSALECIRKLREAGCTNVECVFLASSNI